MNEEILDRRVRKTRRQLKECLTRLLKEKKIQDITVRDHAGQHAGELCDHRSSRCPAGL